MKPENHSVIKIMLAVAIMAVFIVSAGAASDQAEYKKGIQVKFKPQNPIESGVYEIQFTPECNGMLTITRSNDNLDILSSCKPKSLSIQFLVPSGMAVYQQKTAASQKTYYQRILQKRTLVTVDEKYTLILTKPESFGRFSFRNNTSLRDDNIVIEDAADQSITANIKMIDAETIRETDFEMYNSLQNFSLANTDKTIYSNLQKRTKILENKIYILSKEINTLLTKIIGRD